MSLMLALVLLQSGPLVSPGAAPPIGEAPLRPGGLKPRRATAAAAPVRSALAQCLDLAAANADRAETVARDWLGREPGSGAAEPLLCLGTAQANGGAWDQAAASFTAGRDRAAASDHGLRARLGAMAGNAALAAGKPDMALGLLDQAAQDAGGGEDRATTGDIALDRARALVALKRLPEAASALVEARAATPNNAQAWLLSATLSRRMGKLADAQAQIATAAELLPVDPEIGLEAGVIAVLFGRDEAARKSWESVVKAAPGSPQAESARAYLEQLVGKK
jgi:tetratricopeptide (TPR) repeat protein